jgi:hypothetical protein
VTEQAGGTVAIKNIHYGRYVGALEDKPGATVVGIDEAYEFILEYIPPWPNAYAYVANLCYGSC